MEITPRKLNLIAAILDRTARGLDTGKITPEVAAAACRQLAKSIRSYT